jgi:hypothetical protein
LKTRLEPFRLADGRLLLEDVDLREPTLGLDGRPAWVIGGTRFLDVLGRARGASGGGPVSIEVGSVGPPAVLALAADAGCWARVASPHELRLAQQAGFTPACIVVDAPQLDDGLILDALTAGVALRTHRGRDEVHRVDRIAGGLRLPRPADARAPPLLPASAFAHCGGLLARVISAAPSLVLDAVWEPPRAAAGASRVVLAVEDADRPGVRATLQGLSSLRAQPASLHGRAEHGDWVLVLAEDALSVHPPHPARPMPRTVLVREGLWRELEPRPLPAAE